MRLRVEAKGGLQGRIKVPGDKSISHRSVMLGSLAEGKTEIEGFLTGEDCLSTVKAFQDMGVKIEGVGTDQMVVHGVGLRGLKEPKDLLDFGNSGTTTRLMLGILAGQKFYSVATGDDSLKSRPMARVTKPLSTMGGEFYGRDNANLLPITVVGKGELNSISYDSPVASAQVKSAVLLAGLYGEGVTEVREPAKSRDHTERMLEYFGANIEVDGLAVKVEGNPKLTGKKVVVPGDISSAAFLMVAAMITEGSEIIIENVGLNPTRDGVIEALRKMKGNFELLNQRDVNGEPIADIKVKSSQLKGTVIDGDLIPLLIDEIPILAVAASQAEGKTIIKDAEELRVKETDRIDAMVKELTRLGVEVKEREDGMEIVGKQQITGGVTCQSYHDHRIAMSMAVAGLIAEGAVEVEGAECINISFPNFKELLDSLSK
ncbi:3-phosphoshikimate 1-carboxyvinyltransferase [Orenia metallireducens]|uniref:3-phosphoshikimate 1-carboxyvinyltransferase n=1 Tax=Orenia metallireducens TaxID=1413210 RepID=A0A285HIW5_9FIRM|nr:3-phosphoshikimate 1-carboxyvinyltransferase [Orenia metallireducens]PRX27469.1 3-phosphoshikimate 1-carboxyvinyltransferase [Orenia metallireducens]SNY34631.1 3-phosphoshikimate 1-carboxyvinyltransferase [Orenia metallireducens]